MIYNEATGEVASHTVSEYAAKRLGVSLNFRDYYWFRSMDKWRSFAAGFDAFFGARFHGSVVFLQTGRPALLVHSDLRVQELTAFYDLPAASSKDILHGDIEEVMRDGLSADRISLFQKKYLERLELFYQTVTKAGLRFFNDADVRSVLATRS
jgi:hypothetical protein